MVPCWAPLWVKQALPAGSGPRAAHHCAVPRVLAKYALSLDASHAKSRASHQRGGECRRCCVVDESCKRFVGSSPCERGHGDHNLRHAGLSRLQGHPRRGLRGCQHCHGRYSRHGTSERPLDGFWRCVRPCDPTPLRPDSCRGGVSQRHCNNARLRQQNPPGPCACVRAFRLPSRRQREQPHGQRAPCQQVSVRGNQAAAVALVHERGHCRRNGTAQHGNVSRPEHLCRREQAHRASRSNRHKGRVQSDHRGKHGCSPHVEELADDDARHSCPGCGAGQGSHDWHCQCPRRHHHEPDWRPPGSTSGSAARANVQRRREPPHRCLGRHERRGSSLQHVRSHWDPRCRFCQESKQPRYWVFAKQQPAHAKLPDEGQRQGGGDGNGRRAPAHRRRVYTANSQRPCQHGNTHSARRSAAGVGAPRGWAGIACGKCSSRCCGAGAGSGGGVQHASPRVAGVLATPRQLAR
mmetsp:Transcript_4065/g.17032  ORF Transcript_4065/g.17032 Transcript_4065/m.17032 type:complete len:465 (-) Transcript_4065:1096-2490(-)